MRSLHIRGRPSIAQLISIALAGLCIGLFVGFGFMSAAETVLTTRAEVRNEEKQLPGTEAELIGTSKQLDTVLQHRDKPQRPQAAGLQSAAPSKADFADQHSIHTLCTSNGSPYLNYQTRIMCASYQLMLQATGNKQHVAFTRILHRTQPDGLMAEVPTFRADPLTPACDGWCEFPVADRPNAVRQFFDAAQKNSTMLQAPWLLMIETDYVWMKPIQAPAALNLTAPSLAFPFDYIAPQFPAINGVMRKMYPESKGPLSDVPGSGPAPVMMRLAEWLKVTPDWERLTAHIEADKESKEKLGWVREMYAFSVAVALQGIKVDLAKPPSNKLIAQPPADASLGEAAMFHYTWGTVFQNSSGAKLWEFDKRVYTDASIVTLPPKPPLPPAFHPALKLQDGKAVTVELHATTVEMLTQINAAIVSLPALSTSS